MWSSGVPRHWLTILAGAGLILNLGVLPARAAPLSAASAGDGGVGVATPTVTGTGSGPVTGDVLPIIAAASVSADVTGPPETYVRARRGGPQVRVAPQATSDVLSGLYYDTALPVYGSQSDASGTEWYNVQLWGALRGWIRADQTYTGNPPPPTPVPPAPPTPPSPSPTPSATFPLIARGSTTDTYNLRQAVGVDQPSIDVLPPQTPVTVHAWRTDETGAAWYKVSTGSETGWIAANGVALVNPGLASVRGQPLWSTVSGKGMWLPAPLLDMADPQAIVSAARALGLTHIYLEVGSSDAGFYGRSNVDRLLPVAHRNGLKVVGWVLTYLDNLTGDVNLCTSIATYTTPSGDQLDGIAPDVEFNMAPDDVSTFAQVLRTELGPSRLVVGVIYPAGSWTGQHYPIAGLLSHWFNVLAPMDYWHDQQQPYAASDVATFIRQSVADIQSAAGNPNYPVAIIGQTYDGFGRDGTGPNSPTGGEIIAALTGAWTGGAIGASFFQWGTTSPDEWDAVRSFRWPGTQS